MTEVVKETQHPEGHRGPPGGPQGFEAMKKVLAEFHEMFAPLGNNEEGMPIAKFHGHWLPAFMPMYWPQIRNFPVRSSDITVLSFPKSGTHWLHYMVYLIETGEFDRKLDSDERVLLELPKPPLPATLERLAAKPGQRILSSHLPPALLPRDIFNGRVIYIYRNPKDVVVSYYHHRKAMANETWPFCDSFDQWARRFISGKFMFGPYPNHVKSYVDLQKEGKKILILRYEDLKKDVNAAIRQIAKFLDKELDDATVEKVREYSSFSRMRDNEGFNWSEAKKVGMFKKDMEFIRKGEVGDWRNHFEDPQLLADFEKYIAESLPAELLPPSE